MDGHCLGGHHWMGVSALNRAGEKFYTHMYNDGSVSMYVWYVCSGNWVGVTWPTQESRDKCRHHLIFKTTWSRSSHVVHSGTRLEIPFYRNGIHGIQVNGAQQIQQTYTATKSTIQNIWEGNFWEGKLLYMKSQLSVLTQCPHSIIRKNRRGNILLIEATDRAKRGCRCVSPFSS